MAQSSHVAAKLRWEIFDPSVYSVNMVTYCKVGAFNKQ